MTAPASSLPRLMTLEQVADYLQINYSTARKKWRTWLAYGVNPIDVFDTGRGPYRFKREEIERMLEQKRLVKDDAWRPRFVRRIPSERVG